MRDNLSDNGLIAWDFQFHAEGLRVSCRWTASSITENYQFHTLRLVWNSLVSCFRIGNICLNKTAE